MNGFFSSSQVSTEPTIRNRALQCGACGLSKDADAVKIKPIGEFQKKILVILESPGEASVDEMSISGKVGFSIRKMFRKCDANLLQDCCVISAVRCQPDDPKLITQEAAHFCLPSIITLIEKMNPRVIITVGALATLSLISHAWNHEPGGFNRWVDFQIPCQEWNCWICPTYDPKIIASTKHAVMELSLARQIKNAVEKADKRPWIIPPKYIDSVEVIIDPDKAAVKIKANMEKIRPNNFTSFDFETNRLKPYWKNARLLSCSICFDDGINRAGKTIAFPWMGEAAKAAIEYLKSPIKKIAQNMKFEDLWSRTILGFPIRRLVWDTMLAMHIQDSRSGICSLSFQSFAVLGMPDYGSHVHTFLTSDNPDGTNRANELDLKDLLLYNGLDSVLTFDIAMKQIKTIKNKSEK